ncbi:efflux RND transporter permease subunit [Helicobacter turcicus]|uniref:MMPL family transporter n=1 Tax=Helicobacter turcicus TaxID=2867412 RepID=A0ABS7JND9_9HELI|nr:MMPL family transporter [Helicobacter turcicus]MBX7490929.1 MMPL family transporter [Helicobacter turcicus]MBX7545783.1 MMPL family transporter [Helicobacter turcicus]
MNQTNTFKIQEFLVRTFSSSFAYFYKEILHVPKRTLAICAIFFFIFGFFALRLSIDASSDSLILENDKDFKTYESLLKNYSTKDFLILAYSPENGDVFSPNSLKTLKELSADLSAIPQVESVLSILNAPLLKSTPNLDLQETLKLNPTLLSKEVDKELAKKEILNHPFFVQNLISKDAKTMGIVINLRSSPYLEELKTLKNTTNAKLEKEKLQQLITLEKKKLQTQNDSTIRELKALQNKYKGLEIGGITLIASDMIAYVKSDLITYGATLSVILALMLWVFFRSWLFVALTLGICFFTLVVSSGIFATLGYQITIVSSNYVSLLLIINVSLVVHLIVTYLEFYEKFPRATQKSLLYATLISKQAPSFFAVLTTMIGFLSLMYSNILPIIHLGIVMSLGVSVALIFTFMLFASILALLPKPKKVAKLSLKQESFLLFCANFAIKKPKTIYTIALLCIVFSVYGIEHLKVENSFVNYFKDSSAIKQGLLKIDKELGGTVPLDILVTFPKKDANKQNSTDSFEAEFEEEFSTLESEDVYWFDSQKLRIAKNVHSYLQTNPYIGSILSLHSLSMLLDNLGIGADDFTIAFLYKNVSLELKNQLFTPYANPEENQLRFSLRTFDSNPNLARNAFIAQIKADLQELLKDENVRVEVNGAMILYNNLLQNLIASQVDTLSFVIGIIFLVFVLIFKSLKLALIALFTNLIPLGAIFGILGATEIPLDLMGVTIAAIALGIGVDDVIHYIHRFVSELKNHSLEQALLNSHKSIGNAMYYTTLIIVVGFCMMMTSNFIPTIYFGFLTTLVMLLMLLSALILLPALLHSFYKKM